MAAVDDQGRDFAPPTTLTLARCEDEPIHVPGAVQPHGCLFDVRADDLGVRSVSSNLRSLLGVGAGDVLGKPLGALFDAPTTAWISEQLAALEPATLTATRAEAHGRSGTVVVHRYLAHNLVEWLADEEHRFLVPARMDQQLAAGLAAARLAGDIPAVLQAVAEGVQAATGYDRVMVYRFHPDWHGEILAEKTEPGLPAYRGLHYPASDIPAQARRLYVETRVRAIADVYARDATLMDAPDEGGAPLDLSHAVLRSVSPVHIQYLRNMGSGATLVTSLLVGGRLWGLIACHHRTRYPVPWYAFERMRRFTDDAAAVITQRVEADRLAREQAQTAGREQLLATLAASPLEGLRQLMDLVAAEGVIAYAGGRALTLGHIPDGALQLPQIVLGQQDDLAITDALRERFSAVSCDAGCAGLAWTVLSRPHQAVVIFVRPEFERTVTWGGNPDKAVVLDPVKRRLNPRGSFDLWKQTVRGRSRPWESDTNSLLALFASRVDAAAWVKWLESSGTPV